MIDPENQVLAVVLEMWTGYEQMVGQVPWFVLPSASLSLGVAHEQRCVPLGTDAGKSYSYVVTVIHVIVAGFYANTSASTVSTQKDTYVLKGLSQFLAIGLLLRKGLGGRVIG